MRNFVITAIAIVVGGALALYLSLPPRRKS